MKRRAILIGLGRIAWSLENDKLRYHPCTHAGTILALRNKFQLVAVCDIDPEQIKKFLKWWPEPVRAFQNPDEMFSWIESEASGKTINTAKRSNRRTGSAGSNTGHIDLAIVATPQDVHTSQALRLMHLGISDVLIEKPPGENNRDIKELQKGMDSTNSRLWINFERRYHSGYRKVQQYIQKESLGSLRTIRGRVYSGASPIHAGSGPLLHDAVHWLDLLFWYCGLPETMTGRILRDKKGLEHSSHLQFHYSNFVASLDTGARNRYFEFEMELDFSRGRIHCGNNGFKIWKTGPSSRYGGFQELKEIRFPLTGSKKNPWINMYSQIATSSEQRHLYNRTQTVQGLQTVQYIDRAYGKL